MILTSGIKINKHEHFKQGFRVHTLLSDFELEDVWQVPIALTSNQSLGLFAAHFYELAKKLTERGVSCLCRHNEP